MDVGVTAKRCSKCHVEKPVTSFSFELKRGVYQYRSDCKRCRSTRRSRMVQRRRAEAPHEMWSVLAGGWARARAKARNLPVDLPRVVVLRIIEQANGRCTYCQRAIDFQCSIHTRQAGPSLDRIVPELGYVESNLVLACYRCNAIKSDASPDELQNLATVTRQLIRTRRLR